MMPTNAELLVTTPGHGVRKEARGRVLILKKDSQVQRTKFPIDQGWKDPEVARALNNFSPSGSFRQETPIAKVSKSSDIKRKHSKQNIVKKVPKHPAVAKAFKKPKKTWKEKLGVNE